MKQIPKNRFSVGRRVLVGRATMLPGTVTSVADHPSVMGEFCHEVQVDGEQQAREVLGCDLQALPGLDEDLQGTNQSTVHPHFQSSRNKQDATPADPNESTGGVEVAGNRLLIFISHSNRDAALAEALIDLLKSSLGLTANQIRCSSVDGYRLPVGVHTENQLRQEVNAAKAVIGLITPSSLKSYFVMFELGARWGADRFLAPLLAGVNARDLSGPLGLLNALYADNEAHLHQLLGEFSERLGLPLQNAASYLRQIARVKQLADAVVPTADSARSESTLVGDIPTIEENADLNALNLWVTNNFSEVQLERTAMFIHGRRLLGQQSEPLADFQTMRLTANADGLPYGVRRRFQVLEFKNPSVPEFKGYVDENFVSTRLPMKGLWQIDLEIRWAGGSHSFKKCLRWDDTSAPRFVTCPAG